MYDLSDELNNFFNEHVKLSKDKVDELYKKKDYNIDRLKSGLDKYNEKNKTDFSLNNTYVQGSVAMGTVTQSDENDYDIDVGILIDEANIKDIGSSKIKSVILSAFGEIDANFKKPPEKLTNCIRFTYQSGYQIDFAVYRKIVSEEHAGSEWRERNPRDIQNWFEQKKQRKGENLSTIVQLLKMFNKSRSRWKMPGGLVTTILVEENLATQYAKTDELLYYSIKDIVDRLIGNSDVLSPVFPYDSILYIESDKRKVNNLQKRLGSQLEKMNKLFEVGCTKLEAIEVWQSFFHHTYWDKLYAKEEKDAFRGSNVVNYTEQYIEELYPVSLKYSLKVAASVSIDGFRKQSLGNFLKNFGLVSKGKKIEFTITATNTPDPYEIYWKVRNVGQAAYDRNMIRGTISKGTKSITEPSSFSGPHFVECYIVKDGFCVARNRTSVPI